MRGYKCEEKWGLGSIMAELTMWNRIPAATFRPKMCRLHWPAPIPIQAAKTSDQQLKSSLSAAGQRPVQPGKPAFLFVIRKRNRTCGKFRARLVDKCPPSRGGRGVACGRLPELRREWIRCEAVDLNGKSAGVAFIRLQCAVCGGIGRKRSIPLSTAG